MGQDTRVCAAGSGSGPPGSSFCVSQCVVSLIVVGLRGRKTHAIQVLRPTVITNSVWTLTVGCIRESVPMPSYKLWKVTRLIATHHDPGGDREYRAVR